MTIQNFDKFVDKILVKQGEEAFEQGKVSSLEELEDGLWVASVEGATTYEVEILLHKNTIRETSCSCEHKKKGVCSHMVAVFLAIEAKKQQEAAKGKQGTKSKRDSLKSLLEKISRTELEEFIKTYMTKNKVFKSDFELYFIDKNENNDFEKKITDIIDQTIKPRYRGGEPQNLPDLNKEIKKHLKTINTYIGNSNYRDAFIFAKCLFVKLHEIIIKSSYLINTFISNTNKVLDVIIFLAEDERVPLSLKEVLFPFLLEQMVKNAELYEDYYDNKLPQASRKLSITLQKEEDYLQAIDKVLDKNRISGSIRRFYTIEKIKLLSQLGKQKEADKIIDKNIEHPFFRRMKVDMLIEKRDYKAAKACLKEGIKELKQRYGTENIVREWEELLLQIAKEEGDFDTMRKYYKKFAFYGDGDSQYYDHWKSTYTAEEWEKVIGEEIKEQETYYNEQKKRFSAYRNVAVISPILFLIYQKEDMHEILWEKVKNTDIPTILNYLHYLKKNHDTEIMDKLYKDVVAYAENAYYRSEYEKVASFIRKMIEDAPEEKEKIRKLIEKLKQRHKKKYSFVQILNEIIIDYKI